MGDFSRAQLDVDLERKMFQGRGMTVEYRTGTQDWRCCAEDTLSIMVDLPGQVQLRFSGKRIGQDTLVNDLGEIIEDMAVVISGVRLDGFPGNHTFLHQRLILDTELGDRVVSNFVGFNGVITLDLLEPHVLGVISSWNT